MSISVPTYSMPPPALEPRWRRSLTILEHQIQEQTGVLNVILVILLSVVVVLPLVLTFYLQSLVGRGLFGSAGLDTFYWPVGQDGWFFLLILLASSVGAAIIARDVATKAMTMYLSRPIRPLDYLAAKTAAVAFWVFLGGVVPGWVGTIIVLALGYVSLPLALEAAAAFLLTGVFLTAAFSSLAVLVSSLTSRSTLAGAGIFGALLGSYIVLGILSGVSGQPGFLYASPIEDIRAVASAAFRATGSSLDPWSGAAVLVGFVAGSLSLTYLRLRAAQVVSE